MDGEKLLMSQRQLQKWHVMGLVEEGKTTLKEATKKIGVSYRQAKRIRRALRVKGVKGIIHGNTGCAPWNRTTDSIRQKVLEFSREVYVDFNDMHFTEKLSEGQQIELNRETVRKLRRKVGIKSIAALSPQAKGRIERLFGTLQDRLIAELGLQGVQSLESANPFLKVFIPKFNRRFAICPRKSEKAWRKVPPELDLDRMISFCYRPVVGNDNSVRIGGLILDLPPGPHRRSYAKAQVEVRQLLNGSWRVYYQDQLIAKQTQRPGSPAISYEPDRDPKDGTRVRRETYGPCNHETEVLLYAIEGGGHTWPGGDQYFPARIIGRTSGDIDANEVVWNFFKRHTLR